MEFDIFFSICHTPVDGHVPSEAEMFANFFDQLEAADVQGYGTAWVAESHLSSEAQKKTSNPVVPHWKGEVGLNTDILQLSHHAYRRTRHIELGSAVMNIICMGGPVAHAERVATALTLHRAAGEERPLHIGFAAGRFDFMNAASGIVPRNRVEEAMGRAWKGKVFSEAAEVFLRLLNGEEFASDAVEPRTVGRDDFRSDEDWEAVRTLAEEEGMLDRDTFALPRQWEFENLKIVPQDWPREQFIPIVGSHDPRQQVECNQHMPVRVFNLSITSPEKIDATHERMRENFHPDGGPWQRSYMPRTVMVFLNDEDGLSESEQSAAAREEAEKALGAYWTALEGTLDPAKVEKAADNAVIGNPAEIADQVSERFHPDDRLMLWFDFFNHDSARVIRNQQAFMDKVVPRIDA